MAVKHIIECKIYRCSAIAKYDQLRMIDFAVETDLPIGSLVGVMFSRSYLDADGESSIWIGYWDSFEVTSLSNSSLNGFQGQLDIDSCDREGLKWFRNAHAEISSVISTAVSDVVSLIFTVGGRQRNKAFGKNNINLRGAMVERNGDTNFIESKVLLCLPMLPSLQPIIK